MRKKKLRGGRRGRKKARTGRRRGRRWREDEVFTSKVTDTRRWQEKLGHLSSETH